MKNFITEDSMPGVVRKVSIPIMLGFFFHTMFNVTDTFFAGKISTEAVAGMSVSFPLFFILISIGGGFSSGMTALIGTELGKKNPAAAAHIHVQGMIFLTLISILPALFGHFLLAAGLRAMGATGAYYDHAYGYTSWLYIFAFCLLFTQGINSSLNALGRTAYYRNFLIGSFFLNVVIDPIFMFGLFGFYRLETVGAAMATLLANFLGIFYLAYKLKKTNFWHGIKPVHFIPKFDIFVQIMAQGIPGFLSMFMVTIFFFVVNYFLQSYGLKAVAAFGIGLRMEQIALIPCIGINMAVLSIIAQNYGAGKYGRVSEAYRYGVKLTWQIVIPLSAGVFIFRKQLMGIFSDDATVIDIGAVYLIFASLFTIANGPVNVNHALLQGLKKPYLAMANGLVRHLLMPAGFLYLVIGLKKPLVWMWAALLISAFTGLLIGFYLARRHLNALPTDRVSL